MFFRTDSNEDAKKEKKQTKKKMKLEPKSSRSRLMQICDSSSDEEDATKSKVSQDVPMDTGEEVVVKKEKENKTPSPEKSGSSNANGGSSGKRRSKVKKTFTRTYEDEDGFISKFIYKIQIFASICIIYCHLHICRYRS